MPGDLLRYLGAPPGFSGWWLVLAAVLVLVVVAWCVGVVVWTLSPARLRRIPVIRGVHARLIRRRFAGSIHAIGAHYTAGALSSRQACGAMSVTLRSFLHVATGVRAQYMHVDDLAASELAAAAPLFAALTDAQFSTTDPVDVAGLGRDTAEVINTWT